jgi:hypothetical protein
MVPFMCLELYFCCLRDKSLESEPYFIHIVDTVQSGPPSVYMQQSNKDDLRCLM